MNESNPLDDALADAERNLGGGEQSAPPPAPSDDASTQAPPDETPSRRGRKPDPNSRRAQREARRAAAGGAAAAPKIQGPPPPVDSVRVVYPPIAPEAVADSLRQLDEQISRAIGTAPLSEAELLEGGGVFAPILDHYMPLLAQEGGLWLPATSFVVMAYGPRLWEAIDRARENAARRKQGLAPIPPKQGAPAANGVGTFPAATDSSQVH